jgi:hypothetical protein
MATRVRTDDGHPCLACGAAWQVEERSIDVPEEAAPVAWVQVRAECSARCWLHGTSLEAYTSAVAERASLGWPAHV